jgi:AraC-like DNA-binding protein
MLPRVLRCSADSSQTLRHAATLLDLIASEKEQSLPGWAAIVSQLVKALFVQALRSFVVSGQASPQGDDSAPAGDLLRAAMDSSIGPVLQLIHSEPQRPWTVTNLAKQTHMSRSAFSERFREVVGQPPLRYLTEYRMRKACELLRETEWTVKQIALRAGYESASSFSNAFKRWTGKAPVAFRNSAGFAAQISLQIPGNGAG